MFLCLIALRFCHYMFAHLWHQSSHSHSVFQQNQHYHGGRLYCEYLQGFYRIIKFWGRVIIQYKRTYTQKEYSKDITFIAHYLWYAPYALQCFASLCTYDIRGVTGQQPKQSMILSRTRAGFLSGRKWGALLATCRWLWVFPSGN